MTLKLNGTNSEAAPAYAGDDADTGLQCGTNELKLVTGGSARATVDSSGHLLVGGSTSIRSGDIEIAKESANSEIQVTESSDSGNGPKLRITRTRGSNLSSPSAVDSGNFIGQVSFDSYDSAAYRTGAKIQASAAANWSSGSCATDLIFYTTASGASSPTERMRILSSGGLTFNGDTAAANALDDYEEGDWTPSFASGGWTGGNLLAAKYVKIGAQVFVQMAIDSLTGTGSTQTLQIGSLPFNSISNGYAAGSADIGEGSVKGVYCRTESNSNRITFFYPSENNSAGRLQLKGNQIGDAYIILGLTYFTNS